MAFVVGLEECRKRKDCNSMLNINSTEIDDDPGTIPLAQPLKENAVDYDAGRWLICEFI